MADTRWEWLVTNVCCTSREPVIIAGEDHNNHFLVLEIRQGVRPAVYSGQIGPARCRVADVQARVEFAPSAGSHPSQDGADHQSDHEAAHEEGSFLKWPKRTPRAHLEAAQETQEIARFLPR